MKRSRHLVGAGGAVILFLPGARPAAAASSVTSGWWTSAPVALAPDVSQGQLLVKGSADASNPVAYAGITFALSDGEEPDRLVLTVAEGSATTPGSTLALCLLDGSASAAAGEPTADGPAFDCTTRVEAAPSSDGTSYDLDISELATSASLDVAVLPTQRATRVILNRPRLDSLQSSSDDPGALGDVAPLRDTAWGASDLPSGSFTGADTSPRVAQPAIVPSPRLPAAAAGTTPVPLPAATGADEPTLAATTSASTSTAAAPRSEGGSSIPTAPAGFAGLAAVAAGLWALAGNDGAARDHDSGSFTDAGETA